MRRVLAIVLALLLSACGTEESTEDSTNDSSHGAESGLTADFIIEPQAREDQILDYTTFITGYSYEHKGGLWSMYTLYGDQVAVTRDRNDSFKEEERIPEDYRSQLSDYAGSGYDRGHLAPNAALDHTEASQSDTFYLSNIVPQAPSFNRYEWKDVEGWIRECSQQKTDNSPLLVITGTDFSNQPDSIGTGVSIPEQLYKVILHIDADNYLRAFALLTEQGSFDWDNLADSIISIDELENRINVDFFSTLPNNLEAELESGIRMACDLPYGVTVSPAIYYDGNLGNSDNSELGAGSIIDYSCESKTTCSAMNSCEEATFYLNSCGISRLDSDQDGVPCESICR